MFNKFTTILQQAVEALASDTPLHEDFVYHWKSVTNFYIENTDDKTPVTDSNIPSHLKQMLNILVQEENERDQGDTGPCMEYLLQHKILETLHTLGKADCPPGMKQQILIFFKNLLGRIQQPLLPHVNVHKPVSRLVRVCGEVQAGPTEQEEISFLCTVCAQLKKEPHLVHFFLRNNQETAKQSNEMSNKTSSTPTSSSSSTSISSNSKPEGYDLVDSLLNLSRSEDSRVAVKACEGLLLLVSTPHETAANATVKDTALCPLLNNRLTSLFTSLPASLDPSDVECVNAKWGLDSHNYSHSDARNFTGKRSLVSFLSWFDYCDHLIIEAYKGCSDYIAQSISKEFLHKTLLGPLLQTDEKAALTSTAVLSKMFQMVRSKQLIREMTDLIVRSSKSDTNDEKPNILDRLLERCDHFSDEISMVTLRLFETMIAKKDSTAIDLLLLDYLKDRAYHANNPGNIVVQTESNDLEWDLEPGLNSQSSTHKLGSQSSMDLDLVGDGPKAHIQKAVNSFLSALPDAAKSTTTNDDDSGYDGYLREAHRMYRDVCSTCRGFNWPPMNEKDATKPERCIPVADYNEGPFLSMLFDKLGRILSQPYGVNLLVTSIVSRLCLTPHPHLHELLVDPLTPLRPKARGVFTIIKMLVEQVKNRMKHVSNFKNRLLLARKKLVSGGHSDEESSQKGLSPHLSSGSGRITTDSLDEHRTFLEGVIVLEEFCKELAAIAFVKHHAQELRAL